MASGSGIVVIDGGIVVVTAADVYVPVHGGAVNVGQGVQSAKQPPYIIPHSLT